MKGNFEHKPVYKDSKDVLLGFSAGLDSVYQAIALRTGYNVKLFYLINGNMYENGQSYRSGLKL